MAPLSGFSDRDITLFSLVIAVLTYFFSITRTGEGATAVSADIFFAGAGFLTTAVILVSGRTLSRLYEKHLASSEQ